MGLLGERRISGGQWLTLAAALLGWMFDGFEQSIVPVMGRPAIIDMLEHNPDVRRGAGETSGETAPEARVGFWIGWLNAVYLLGAADGGRESTQAPQAEQWSAPHAAVEAGLRRQLKAVEFDAQFRNGRGTRPSQAAAEAAERGNGPDEDGAGSVPGVVCGFRSVHPPRSRTRIPSPAPHRAMEPGIPDARRHRWRSPPDPARLTR